MEMYHLVIVVFFSLFLLLIKKLNKPKNLNQKVIDIDLSKYTYYDEFEITGVHINYRKEYIINFVKIKYPIKLQRERDNVYSENAIKIMCEGAHIGYVTELDVEEVGNIIEGDYFAFISVLDFDGGYLDLHFKIFFN